MKLKTNPSFKSHTPIIHGGLNSIENSDIVDFSSNVTPLGASQAVKTVLKNNLAAISDYPDANSSKLEKSLQKYTTISSSNLVVGNGATELIYNFCNAFLSKKSILLTAPTFGEYEAAAKLNDCSIKYFNTMNLEDDLKQFIKQIPKNGCVFVCNPNNPTGRLTSKKSLKEIIYKCKKNSSFVFVDECFIEMTPDKNESVILLTKQFDNLFVLRSLTKSFGLAGLRIGYGIGNKQIVSILKKIKIPWSVNSLAQLAAVTALNHLSHLQKSKVLIKKESKYLKEKISNINGFMCYDTSTNFLLIHTKLNSTKLQNKLLKRNILVRDCKNFHGLNNHYIRIAVKTRKENNLLLRELKKICVH